MNAEKDNKFLVYSQDGIVEDYEGTINPYYAFVIEDNEDAKSYYPSQLEKTPLPIFAPDSVLLCTDDYIPVQEVQQELAKLYGDRFVGWFNW